MNEKWAHSPDFKLFREGVVETAHGTGAGSHSHERLGYFPNFMGTGSRDKHLSQPICHLLLIPIVTLEDLRVNFPRAVSGNVQIFNGTTGCRQITRVEAIAIAFAFGCAFSPGRSHKEKAEVNMHVLYQRCAGIDVHQRFLVVCLSIIEAGQQRKEVRTFRTETADLLALRA
jgi:hypothetical protein